MSVYDPVDRKTWTSIPTPVEVLSRPGPVSIDDGQIIKDAVRMIIALLIFSCVLILFVI